VLPGELSGRHNVRWGVCSYHNSVGGLGGVSKSSPLPRVVVSLPGEGLGTGGGRYMHRRCSVTKVLVAATGGSRSHCAVHKSSTVMPVLSLHIGCQHLCNSSGGYRSWVGPVLVTCRAGT
jgi:hypothetical protein